jgi:hypothetical protein
LNTFLTKYHTIKLTYDDFHEYIRLEDLQTGEEIILSKIELKELLPKITEWLEEE